MASMESIYGKEVLLDIVNAEVMEAAAKKYKIKVTDEEVDLELALIRSTQDGVPYKPMMKTLCERVFALA